MAIQSKLRSQATATGVGPDRLYRRLIFERIVARLEAADPGRWVLKGGMALEVRLADDARVTRDLDLGLRSEVSGAETLEAWLAETLATDPYGDLFQLVLGRVVEMRADGAGHITWRSTVEAYLGRKKFGTLQVDISPRPHELERTDVVPLPNLLDFAGVDAPSIEIIDVHRHATEKFHGMLKDFGERENSRARDLVDLVLLIEHEMIEGRMLEPVVRQVWQERNGTQPPTTILVVTSWVVPYEELVIDLQVDAKTFPAAVALVTALWLAMFPTKET